MASRAQMLAMPVATTMSDGAGEQEDVEATSGSRPTASGIQTAP